MGAIDGRKKILLAWPMPVKKLPKIKKGSCPRRRIEEKKVIWSTFWGENPGVITKVIFLRKIKRVKIIKNRIRKIRLIIEEIFSLSSSGLSLYLIKMGIKEEVSAPVIRISKIISGIRKEAKKMSNCSLGKYEAKTRNRKKPKKRAKTMVAAIKMAEEKIVFCWKKINDLVTLTILFIVFNYISFFNSWQMV